ncbi:hypothetical protein [Arthrobacter oryzae]|uniref:hypothetical protein n=1 Tax=Arthrobacter oryzae TaxID=409290 RepID=UPI0030C9CF25
MGIGLLDSLTSCKVGTEGPDDVTLLGVLGSESVDVYSLSPELVAERILALSASGQISN